MGEKGKVEELTVRVRVPLCGAASFSRFAIVDRDRICVYSSTVCQALEIKIR